jgi:nucleotide-binding universal stress UspA family protein
MSTTNRKILVATDFSEHGQLALDYATELARDRDATLLIVHVKEPPPYFPPASYGYPRHLVREDWKILRSIVPSDASVGFVHVMRVSDPVDEIVRLADQEQVEMIVMATHQRTGLSRVLMVSIAQQVTKRANCPVLTVKRPAMVERGPPAAIVETSRADCPCNESAG